VTIQRPPKRWFSRWDQDTGEIDGAMILDDAEVARRRGLGENWIEGDHDAATHHVDPATGELTEHSALPITIEGNAISGIPAGAKVIVRDEVVSGKVLGGVLRLDVAYEQDIAVHIAHPRHANQRIVVECCPCEPVEGAHRVPQDRSRLREVSYRPKGDQLDDIMRAIRALRDSGLVALPRETLDAITDWEGVKARFPKPES
jgi:hypothetical protein